MLNRYLELDLLGIVEKIYLSIDTCLGALAYVC